MSLMPETKEQRELVKRKVQEQQNRSDFMNYLFDRSGRADLEKGQFPSCVFTGLADEFAYELGREMIQDMTDNWHIESVKEKMEVRDNAKKILQELKDEAKN